MSARSVIMDNRICIVEHCGQPAARFYKDGPLKGRGLCMAHFEFIGQMVVEQTLADPEIRLLLGLDRDRQ